MPGRTSCSNEVAGGVLGRQVGLIETLNLTEDEEGHSGDLNFFLILELDF